MNIRKLKLTILISTALTLIVNMLAVILPLNGKTTASISDQFDVYFVPANYVFSIWSLIYIGLIAFSIYQFRLKDNKYKIVKEIAPLVILSSIFNSLWLFMWHYEMFMWTLPLMIALLICLIVINVKLIKAKNNEKPKFFELFIRIPFSIYLGWITVATVANITDILFLLNWNGFGVAGPVWASLLIFIAGLLAFISLQKNSDFAYASVIIWAITGIAVKFPAEFSITTSAIVVVCILLITSIIKQFYPNTRK